MNNNFTRALVAFAVVVLALMACSMLGSSALIEDDFSNGDTWGTGADDQHSVKYSNGALQMSVNKDLYFVWSTPNGEDYKNVHIEATAYNHSPDPAAFGIICNLQITNTSYYFAITGNGKYAIGKYTFAGDTLLTNDGQWGNSNLIKSGANSYRIGADCGSNGTLTLYVDGQQVDSASDTAYSSGSVGLFAWSGEELNGTDVSFDDFAVTKLK